MAVVVMCALALGAADAAPWAHATPTSPRILSNPGLSNLFLTRQGASIPPQTCLLGTNTATFSERLDAPVTEQLAGFAFDLTYDEAQVCLRILPGPAASAMDCSVQDDSNSLLRNVARISCATTGAAGVPDTATPEGRHLATIVVRPQPDVYTSTRPAYANSTVALVTLDNCALIDLQGGPIPLVACDDAAATLRYLEGDVAGPNCAVTVLDMLAIVSRFGTALGNVRYSTFYDLEPSTRGDGDGDIDIRDLQVVTGRFSSTCATPRPPQPPLNPTG